MHSSRRPLSEALFATDWSQRFESFSVEESRRLETFNDLMWDTTGWSFFQQPVRFHFRSDAHGSEERFDYAGPEALRAAADDFRQLWLNDEPASYHAITAILRAHLSSRSRRSSVEMLDGAGRAYKDAKRAVLMWTDVPHGQVARAGSGRPVRAHQVVDDWMHGIKAHRDRDKRERVLSWSPVAYEFTLFKALRGYVDAMLLMHVVVRSALGVLYEDRREMAAVPEFSQDQSPSFSVAGFVHSDGREAERY